MLLLKPSNFTRTRAAVVIIWPLSNKNTHANASQNYTMYLEAGVTYWRNLPSFGKIHIQHEET